MKQVLEIVMKNRKAQVMVLLLVALVAVDAGFYFLRTAPATSMVAAYEDRIEEMREGVRKKEGEYRLYQSFESGRAGLAKFKDLLPKRSDYIDIIRKVYRLAKEDGMTTSSFGTEKRQVEQEGDLEQLSFSIPVSGKYANVRKFIYDVETSPVFLNIDNLSLTGGETGEISLTIGLSTYVRA